MSDANNISRSKRVFTMDFKSMSEISNLGEISIQKEITQTLRVYVSLNDEFNYFGSSFYIKSFDISKFSKEYTAGDTIILSTSSCDHLMRSQGADFTSGEFLILGVADFFHPYFADKLIDEVVVIMNIRGKINILFERNFTNTP